MIHGVFLDRDGTLVDDPGYLRDPDAVRLLPGTAGAIHRLNGKRIRVVVVTNQSGIARGLIRPDAYQAVTRRLEELLRASAASVDAIYHCPHYPPLSGPCGCRKPGTLLYRTAGAHFGLDLSRCVWVGDRLSDVSPAHELGGRGLLVRTGEGDRHAAQAAALGLPVVDDFAAAVDYLLGAAPGG